MQVQSKIQRWGNGLAIRISGLMRDIPHFEEGMPIEVEVTEEGLVVRRQTKEKAFSEAELLKDMTPYMAHAEEMTILSSKEMGL